MIRVFPERTKWTPTDGLAFVGDPPLFRPADPETPVRVSVTFTWHKPEGERLADSWSRYYRNVQIDGPAYGHSGGEFAPGMFLKEGCTITSRGCIKKCPWCFVPRREGALRELQIKPGWIVQDNNLLACSEAHIRAVFAMLMAQGKRVWFNGGLDKSLLQPWHRELFDSIKIGELWFACDTSSGLHLLERAAQILSGIPIRKLRCYAMIGFGGETISQAETRLKKVLQLGFLPFAQLFQSDTGERREYPEEWRKLCRAWMRPAIMLSQCK